MFGLGSIAFTGFFSVQNFLNLFIDNAYLLILAVGMTFVIISGGIDLSVGSMLGPGHDGVVQPAGEVAHEPRSS